MRRPFLVLSMALLLFAGCSSKAAVPQEEVQATPRERTSESVERAEQGPPPPVNGTLRDNFTVKVSELHAANVGIFWFSHGVYLKAAKDLVIVGGNVTAAWTSQSTLSEKLILGTSSSQTGPQARSPPSTSPFTLRLGPTAPIPDGGYWIWLRVPDPGAALEVSATLKVEVQYSAASEVTGQAH